MSSDWRLLPPITHFPKKLRNYSGRVLRLRRTRQSTIPNLKTSKLFIHRSFAFFTSYLPVSYHGVCDVAVLWHGLRNRTEIAPWPMLAADGVVGHPPKKILHKTQ